MSASQISANSWREIAESIGLDMWECTMKTCVHYIIGLKKIDCRSLNQALGL